MLPGSRVYNAILGSQKVQPLIYLLQQEFTYRGDLVIDPFLVSQETWLTAALADPGSVNKVKSTFFTNTASNVTPKIAMPSLEGIVVGYPGDIHVQSGNTILLRVISGISGFKRGAPRRYHESGQQQGCRW